MPLIPPNSLRAAFAQALSNMYQKEVPLYGNLLQLVAKINSENDSLLSQPEKLRLRAERHGAIRLGTPAELRLVARMFKLLGMHPVGYYDLTVAALPMHACAFRPLDGPDLLVNPFRVFCSLIRPDLLQPQVRSTALKLLAARQIMSDPMQRLLAECERQGGVEEHQLEPFLDGALDVFQWHSKTTTTLDDYNLLASASPLLADVCCFPGPHINHLTPSTLDIDAAQQEMKAEGIPAKQIIEGPPRRPNVPILLRQTSFQAIQEPIVFVDHDHEVSGKHRARFGEIEERGAALTPKGKKLYERLLFQARQRDTQAMDNASYQQHLAHVFATFPDDLLDLIQQDLVYVAYEVAQEPASDEETQLGLVDLLASGRVRAKPLIYEDFLPASAAGIFSSNLGADKNALVLGHPDKEAFEEALQSATLDEDLLYYKQQRDSLTEVAKTYPQVLAHPS